MSSDNAIGAALGALPVPVLGAGYIAVQRARKADEALTSSPGYSRREHILAGLVPGAAAGIGAAVGSGLLTDRALNTSLGSSLSPRLRRWAPFAVGGAAGALAEPVTTVWGSKLYEKASARAGLRRLRQAYRGYQQNLPQHAGTPHSMGNAQQLQQLNEQAQRYAQAGAIKSTPMGSQIRHLGTGGEGTATLTAGATVAPQGGLSVRKVFDTNRVARSTPQQSAPGSWQPSATAPSRAPSTPAGPPSTAPHGGGAAGYAPSSSGSWVSEEAVRRKFQNYRRWTSSQQSVPAQYLSHRGQLGSTHDQLYLSGNSVPFRQGQASPQVSEHLGLRNVHLPDLYSRNLQRTQGGLPYYHTQYTPGIAAPAAHKSFPLPATRNVNPSAQESWNVMGDLHGGNVMRTTQPSGMTRNYVVDFTVDPVRRNSGSVARTTRVQQMQNSQRQNNRSSARSNTNRQAHVQNSFQTKARS